jgi:hypothetical protein
VTIGWTNERKGKETLRNESIGQRYGRDKGKDERK